MDYSNTPLCADDWSDVADWFATPGSKKSREAKRICGDCPLKWPCATKALDDGIPYGVFGGIDERQRREVWAGERPSRFEESIQAALKTALQFERERNVA